MSTLIASCWIFICCIRASGTIQLYIFLLRSLAVREEYFCECLRTGAIKICGPKREDGAKKN
jgi:hypothetical protein